MASHIEKALQIGVDIKVIPPEQEVKWMRAIAEKKLIPNWDIFLASATALFYEATPVYFHREFFGSDGALRAGLELPKFDELFKKIPNQIKKSFLRLLRILRDTYMRKRKDYFSAVRRTYML